MSDIDEVANSTEDTKKPLVLIVEDNKFSAELIYDTIGGNYRRVIASTGMEAIEVYFKEKPIVVFLDIELPDISGHDVLRIIKYKDKKANIVMLSGCLDKDNIEKSVKNKSEGIIGKPFSGEKLLSYIKRYEN